MSTNKNQPLTPYLFKMMFKIDEFNNLNPKSSVFNFKTFANILVGYLLFFRQILNDATVSLSAESNSTHSRNNSFFKT